MNQKNTPTRSSRLAAIVTMTATSFANTDADRRSITTASREAIANPADRTDERRMFGVVPKLLAQTADEHVDGAVVRLRFDAAHRFHDAITRQDTPAVSHEEAEQFELGRRQAERSTLERRRLRRPVDLQRADTDDFLVRMRTSAEDRLHARDELTGLEWFRQVVVRTELEPEDSIGDIATSGQHDDRDAARFPHFPADGE